MTELMALSSPELVNDIVYSRVSPTLAGVLPLRLLTDLLPVIAGA